MLKVIVWSAVVSATGAAALFVPIDPSLLKAVGLSQGGNTPVVQDATQSDSAPLKIVSSSAQPDRKMAIRVLRRPAVSPYQAQPKQDASSKYPRIKQLAIAAAPRLKAPPILAAEPVTPTSASVIRSLQNELRRVGCYHGRIDGDWGPASRFAMAAFTRAVNAALPTDRPDVILLTLVRRHAGTACGLGRAAPVQTATAIVPQARVKTTSAWRVRVAPAQPPASARLVRRPRRQQPHPQLVDAPRIIRADGTHTPSADISRLSPVIARAGPFNGERMSLGVVPAPTAVRPVTTDEERVFVPHTRRAERRRYRSSRARTRRVNRRRYRRRNRTRAWRRTVFPGIYN